MAINAVLRELFAHKTQAQIAAELTAGGMPTDQTKVSGWRRSRQPTLDQIKAIEDWAGKPRGWVLARAGYAMMPGVEPVSQYVDDRTGALEAQVEKLAADLRKLQLHVGTLGAATVRASHRAKRSAPRSPGGDQ